MARISLSHGRVVKFRISRLYAVLPCFVLFSTVIALTVTGGQKDTAQNGTTTKAGRRVLSEVIGPNDQPVPKCIPPAIDDFPEDFFTQEERLRGGMVIHFLIAIYVCAMIAVVCDEYFVPALEILCDYMKVPTDIAGATFMAIGTSSPELFSSIIGVFITEGDIGVGTIVGSAVFNILGVTSISGLAVWNSNVPIDWFPIARDCLMYAVTVIVLILIISNNIVSWWEALVLVLMFLLYVLIMYHNAKIEHFCTEKVEKLKLRWQKAKPPVDTNENTPRLADRMSTPKNSKVPVIPTEKTPLLADRTYSPEIKDPESAYDTSDDESFAIGESMMRSRRESEIILESVKTMDEEDNGGSLCSMPHHGVIKQILWVLMWPSYLIFFLTIPDCRNLRFRKLFLLTFLASVVWLGLLSYVCVWMVTIIGYTLGIPDTVSGITLLAAGTSIPEVISSVLVVRNGLGNMAICNLIGSNIFDILFCLGGPWLIKTAFFSSTGYLVINSSAMTYTTATLLSTVAIIFVTFHLTKWNLNWRVGIACLILYAGFLVLACMYELNVFGDFNPPPCPR